MAVDITYVHRCLIAIFLPEELVPRSSLFQQVPEAAQGKPLLST